MNEDDVEWVDVENADWDVICDEDAAAIKVQDVSVQLTGAEAGKGRRRVPVPKWYQEQCIQVHKAHVLLLIARACSFDQAASNLELQALLLSQVEQQLLLKPQYELQRSINCLQPLLQWFNSTFSYAPTLFDDAEEKGSSHDTSSVGSKVHKAAELHAGPCEELVALFVALIRAQGLHARVVRLLDAAPLQPWRVTKPASLRTVSSAEAAKLQGKAARAKSSGAGTSSSKQAAAAASPAASKKTRKGGSAAKEQGPAEDKQHPGGQPASGQATRGRTGKRKQSAGADQEAGPLTEELSSAAAAAAAAASAASSPSASGSNKKQKTASSPSLQQPAHSRAAPSADAAKSPSSRPNRGEEEFEFQLQMAMMASALEAEQAAASASAAHAHAASSSKGAGQAAVRKRLRDVLQRKAGSAPAGALVASRSTVDCNCWAEVWCGSPETGRWVHVDVINAYIDRPDIVDSTAASRNTGMPVRYMVACQDGAARDVTARYVSSILGLHKVRPEGWWAATAQQLEQLAAAMQQRQQQAQQRQQAGVTLTGSDGAGTDQWQPPQQQQVHDAAAAAAANQASTSKASSMLSPFAAEATAAVPLGSQMSLPAQQQQQQPGSSSTDQAALLRSRREEAELRHRSASQLQGLPTSIEGFKNHPLYVLKRHISKYEVLRPGTVALGLHRGESYYPRTELSVLHTAERWRRKGLEVRPEELGKPAKVVNKRKALSSAASGGLGGGRKLSRGTLRGASWQLPEDEDMEVVTREGPAEAPDGKDAPATINLYGHWQTKPWERPKAHGGIVPKNKHGNVECPPLVPSIPEGTVHLQYPRIGPICVQLGVDYAPAIVGFEMQGGHMLPKLDGVVVCEEFEAQVVHAYLERETAKQAAAAERRHREARALWLQLVQATRVRMQLAASYENQGTGGHNAASMAAMAAGSSQPAAGDGSPTGEALQQLSAVEAVKLRLQQEAEQRAQPTHNGVADMEVEDI